jgi:hypothetical protein
MSVGGELIYNICIDSHTHKTPHHQSCILTMPSLLKSLCLLAFAPLALAAAVPSLDAELVGRDTACHNGPLTRACWNNGYRLAHMEY